MKQKTLQPYLLLLGTLLLLFSFPQRSVDKLQGTTVAFLAPAWIQLGKFKKAVSGTENEELQRLKLENHLLVNEISALKEHFQLQKTPEFPTIAAHVIFRSPSSWNSSLWIDTGYENNGHVIKKNSPVLFGTSIVGVIDYVGSRQSRVRLITDSGLTPSVRAKRIVNEEQQLLAKGELHGSSQPLWRSNSHMLKGIGFNYDFSDEEGPARDLRTGEPLHSNAPAVPIIEVGDLLVTTGMDGVFPPGLEVATVANIQMLREGDYFYELEAKPAAGNLDELSLLFVIPPLGYDPLEQPPLLGDSHYD